MSVITIIGAGMMGSALAFPARENENEVRLVGTPLDYDIISACKKTGRHPKFDRDFPDGVKYYTVDELSAALDGADAVIGGVSSFGVDWFSKAVLPLIPEALPILSVTKGLFDTPDGRLLTYPDLWNAECERLGKKLSINAIGGPCTSYELVFHDQSEVTFCGKNRETLAFLKKIMSTDYYHISTTTDVTGLESAVALKNGYALGIALTIGVNQRLHGTDSTLHFNSQAAVFGQSVREMGRLMKMQGAGSNESYITGIGDLYVTVYGGRTRLVGVLLGRGLTIDEAEKELCGVTLESLVVAKRVARAVKVRAARGELDANDFPLLLHVDDILNGAPVNIPWEKFTYCE